MHSFEVNTSNVPAFLIKLWKLVEDPSCDELIAWSDNGASFIIKDQARFSNELLPQYFKHNNMASFVRQLNMYGFRKVMNYERSGLKSDNNEMEFQHNFFIQKQSELLEHIKRKIPNAREPHTKSNPSNLLTDLTSIKSKQESMDALLMKMKKTNEYLWKEMASMRQKHKQQEQVIQKVIHFLVQVIRNQPVGLQRTVPMMLHDSPTSSKITTVDLLKKAADCILIPDKNSPSNTPVIHEVDDFEVEEPLSVGSIGRPSSSINSPEPAVLNRKTTPNIVVASPAANNSEENETVFPASPLECINLSSPADLVIPSMLHPLQHKTLSVPDDNDETILSLPVDYITASDVETYSNLAVPSNVVIPGKNKTPNIITLSKKKDSPKVMRLPTENDIYEVISPPDTSNAVAIPKKNVVNIISLPEGTDISNIISIPEGADISNIINSLSQQNKDTPNTVVPITVPETVDDSVTVPDSYDPTACLNDLKANSLDDIKSPLNLELQKQDYDDPLMSDSLNTPQVNLNDNFGESPFSLVDCKPTTPRSITEQEHNYPAPLAADNETNASLVHQHKLEEEASERIARSLTENTLSNHLLQVEEELNRLQDNFATNTWEYDTDKLLGLFSSDGMVGNESLVDQLTDGISIKKEPEDDILENDLMTPLTPQILDIADLQSPFFEQFNPDMITSDNLSNKSPDKNPVSSDQDFEENVEPDMMLEESEFLSPDTTSPASKRRKNTKTTKGKRRKLK